MCWHNTSDSMAMFCDLREAAAYTMVLSPCYKRYRDVQ